MSIKIMSQIWESGLENQNELLAMLALSNWANDEGYCWPSIKAIAEKIRMSERGAQKIIRRLEEKGYLEINTGGGRKGCNEYKINSEPACENPERMFTPEHSSPPNDCSPPPRTSVQKTPNSGSPEPSRTIIEPSKEKYKKEKLDLSAISKIVGEELTQSFFEMRREIKKPLTQRAVNLLASRLASFKQPAEAVERSIINSWAGVFENERDIRPNQNQTVQHDSAGQVIKDCGVPFHILAEMQRVGDQASLDDQRQRYPEHFERFLANQAKRHEVHH